MPAKHLPGQRNSEYEGAKDPNAEFLGTQSLHGGGDPSFVYRALRALFSWRDRRRGRGSSR